MLERIDCAVIGAGVVGLAVARQLALAGLEVIVLEAASAIGSETSSRNSEVIHAGIYYPPGSLKARLCVAGRHALYRYCEERGVPHARPGKLLVASRDEEVAKLDHYLQTARANGVEDLRRIPVEEARALEPAVKCRAALLSPCTGIIDSHALMQALQGDAQRHGAVVALKSPVLGGEIRERGILLQVGGDDPMDLACETVVNCAGLYAQDVARSIAGVPPETVPPRHLAKGHYFTLSGRCPFRHLIYPVPEPGGLGVHVTLDLGGQARFGPDVAWVDAVDYSFDESRAPAFYAAIRSYWPGLADGALQPGYTGIRPKISGPGAPAADFMILGPRHHGVPGLVNLFGIESPGLTACLAIADYVAQALKGLNQ